MVNKAEKDNPLTISLYSRLVSFFCLVAPCFVMAGWALDNRLLKTWDMIGPAMNPLTAICILICGTILFLFTTGNTRWIMILSWATMLLITSNFLFHFYDFHLDGVLFKDRIAAEIPVNHMSFLAGLALVLVCFGFTAMVNQRYKLSQVVFLSVFFFSLSVFIAYLYGDRPLMLFPDRTPMALNTSLSLIFLSSGSALLYRDKGFIRNLLGPGSGAKLARWVLPVSFTFVILLGFLRLQFETAMLNQNTGLALIASLTIILFFLIIFFFSFQVNRAEEYLIEERKVVFDLNKKLHLKNRELQIKNEELEKFAQAITHDIRSPLGAIMNVSEKMLDEGDQFTVEERKDFLRLIHTTSASVIERATQMLELAKAARKPIKKVPVNSGFVVSEVLKELRAESNKKDIDLQMKGLPVVMADKALLKSVFHNLINNAVKYSKGKAARIIISCHNKGREKIFSVKDSGIGLDMKSITRLFKPYSRLAQAGNVKGTGLGLSIVKRIIERHGGKVWAKPGDKGGAVFYFSLPS